MYSMSIVGAFSKAALKRGRTPALNAQLMMLWSDDENIVARHFTVGCRSDRKWYLVSLPKMLHSFLITSSVAIVWIRSVCVPVSHNTEMQSTKSLVLSAKQKHSTTSLVNMTISSSWFSLIYWLASFLEALTAIQRNCFSKFCSSLSLFSTKKLRLWMKHVSRQTFSAKAEFDS